MPEMLSWKPSKLSSWTIRCCQDLCRLGTCSGLENTSPCDIAHREAAQLRRRTLMASAEAGAPRMTRFAQRVCMLLIARQVRLCRPVDWSSAGVCAQFEQERDIALETWDRTLEDQQLQYYPKVNRRNCYSVNTQMLVSCNAFTQGSSTQLQRQHQPVMLPCTGKGRLSSCIARCPKNPFMLLVETV